MAAGMTPQTMTTPAIPIPTMVTKAMATKTMATKTMVMPRASHPLIPPVESASALLPPPVGSTMRWVNSKTLLNFRFQPWLAALLLGLVAALGTGCAALNQVLPPTPIKPPKVELSGISLVSLPGEKELTAYYCPLVVKSQIGLFGSGGADLLCSQFFGAAPAPNQLGIAFDVRVKVDNPNRVPLPLAALAADITLFPGDQDSHLGTTCVTLCEPGQTDCVPADENACEYQVDVTDEQQVATAAAGLLVSQGVRLASGEPLAYEAPKVLASDANEFIMRLSLAPEELLPLIKRLAESAAGQLKKGKLATFSIPYELAGHVIAHGGSAGKLAVPYGPVQGEFKPE